MEKTTTFIDFKETYDTVARELSVHTTIGIKNTLKVRQNTRGRARSVE